MLKPIGAPSTRGDRAATASDAMKYWQGAVEIETHRCNGQAPSKRVGGSSHPLAAVLGLAPMSLTHGKCVSAWRLCQQCSWCVVMILLQMCAGGVQCTGADDQVPARDSAAALVPEGVPSDAHGRLPALLRHLHRALLHLRQRLGPQGAHQSSHTFFESRI